MSLYKPIKIPVSEAPAITVDDELNGDSTNPLQNKVVNQALYNLSQQMGNCKIEQYSYTGTETTKANKTISLNFKPKFFVLGSKYFDRYFVFGMVDSGVIVSMQGITSTCSWDDSTNELTIVAVGSSMNSLNYDGVVYDIVYFG